jgi:hypothetical protein
MRALDRGQTFVVTRNGVPVGELRPLGRRPYVPAADVVAAFASSPAIDRARFRRDLDSLIEQDAVPRG